MAASRTLIIFALSLLLILELMHESEAKSRSSRSKRSSARRPAKKTKHNPQIKNPKRSTFHSSVTYRQTKGQHSSFPQRFAIAAATGIVTYRLANSLLYSRRFTPYYDTSTIVIPKHRALRVKSEQYNVIMRDGTKCRNGTLLKHDPKNLLNVTTKILYKVPTNVTGKVNNISSLETTDPQRTNLTVSTDAVNGHVVWIESRTFYNRSILRLNGTNMTDVTENCTVLFFKAEAYVVEMVESFALKTTSSFALSLLALLAVISLI